MIRLFKRPGVKVLMIGLVILVFFLSGCSSIRKTRVTEKPKDASSLVKLSPSDYPDFVDDLDFEGMEKGLGDSISYFREIPKNKQFVFGKDSYDRDHMILSLETFLSFIRKKPDSGTIAAFIRDHFEVYASSGNRETGGVLFTGYYEPMIKGSLTQNNVYGYPIFSIPDDLLIIDLGLFDEKQGNERKIVGRNIGNNTVVPYYDRKEIGNGDILAGKSKVIAYVEDRIDLFFLEIQGSGIVCLDNGETLRVHYHTSNGKPYKSIGEYLIRSGKIPKEIISAQAIKTYIKSHPDETDAILNKNPSYIFFRTENGGPYGCYGTEVTQLRSIATDRRIFPACALAYIKTEKPNIDDSGKISEWKPFGRFVLNQDTGGAILGPGRVDLFMGNGKSAEITAGNMKQPGLLYFLVLKKTNP